MSLSDPAEPAEPPSADDAVAVVILTAGRGTRMRSSLPKVLHPLAGLPMAQHVVRAVADIEPQQLIVTLGPTSAALRDTLGPNVSYAWQPEALGTGDAVAVALPLLDPAIEWVVVIYGDHPLLDAATLRNLIAAARREQPIVALLGVRLDDPGAYGRFLYRDGRIVGTIEAHDDATTYSGPTLINSGMCCYRRDWLAEHVTRLPLSPKGEYYLTALVERAAATDWPFDPVLAVEARPDIALGINDRVELAAAEAIIRRRVNESHMRAGVTLVDPDTTYIDVDVEIGADTRIEPGCALRGRTIVGASCRLGPNTVIEDSEIGDEAVIRSSWIESSVVHAGVSIGPYSHLRPGAIIEAGAHLGNFVEVKNARIGADTQIGHFSYIGDATLGERVNIGAGSITCNFDGTQKHRTEIGDDAFVGSDTLLVAPVSLGAGARTGAGAVVTKPIPPGKLAVGMPARLITPRAEREPTEQDGD